MSKQFSNMLLATFWFGAIVCRAASIFMTAYFRPRKLLPFSAIGCLLSGVLLLLFGCSSVFCFFIGTVGYGIFRGPMPGIAFSLVNQSFSPSGKQTSFIFLVRNLGEAIHPGIISQVIDYNPNFFLYYVGAFILLQQLALVSLPFVCQKFFKEKLSRANEEESSSPIGKRMSRLSSMVPPCQPGSRLSIKSAAA